MRLLSRLFWLMIGVGIGFALGTRAGRERYDQVLGWGRRTADDFGVSPAIDQVLTSAKETASGLRDHAAETSSDTLGREAQAVSDKISAAGRTDSESD